jgi:hypothetical protein
MVERGGVVTGIKCRDTEANIDFGHLFGRATNLYERPCVGRGLNRAIQRTSTTRDPVRSLLPVFFQPTCISKPISSPPRSPTADNAHTMGVMISTVIGAFESRMRLPASGWLHLIICESYW